MTTSAAHTVSAASFARLMERLHYLDAADRERVRQAYLLADRAHSGQTRKSGDPYITHPIAVTAQCSEWCLDAQALMAALLHDTIEDCGISKNQIAETFDPAVADLVDGLTKLDKLQFSSRQENQAESFRKMLLVMARDVRVILIKLADRLHNMRTMSDMKPEAQRRIATETMEIYAPIANRLGMDAVHRELQNLSFQYLHPWRHAILAKAADRIHQRRQQLWADLQQRVRDSLHQLGLSSTDMAPHAKNLYTIYHQMRHRRCSFAQLQDRQRFLLIVPNSSDCYLALGALHALYKPVPQRLKDFIAIPKSNGYQSLHTTLTGPAGITMDFFIRTPAMHRVAESGIASRWMDAPPGEMPTASEQQPASWIQSLLHIQHETHDAHEFFDHVRLNLFPEDIFVFTPGNHVMSLPRGATAVDFAYAVHSDVGDHAVSARINSQPAPLRSELHSGDVVEIITDPQSRPNPAWLGFVRTARARSRIRHHLKSQSHQEAVQLGQRLLEQAYKAEGMGTLPAQDDAHMPIWKQLLASAHSPSLDALFADMGHGKLIGAMLARQLAVLMMGQGQRPNAVQLSMEHFSPEEQRPVLALDGSEQRSITYATCCHPLPGDPILGYLGQGEGLVVHTDDCPVAQRLHTMDSERFVPVEWADQMTRLFPSAITISMHNRIGAIAAVTAAIASTEANIGHISTSDDMQQEVMDIELVLQVRNRQHMAHVLRAIRHIPAAIRAVRRKPAAATPPSTR